MKEQLFKFYNYKINNKKLVFKYMQLWIYAWYVSALITIILTGIFIIKKEYIKFILSFSPFMVFFIIVNQKAKKIVKDKYGINSSEFIWGGVQYDKMKRNLIVKYLIYNNLYNEKKIRILIDLYNKETEHRRNKNMFNGGLFLSIFIPIWSQIIGIVFKKSNSYTEMKNIFLIICTLAFMIYMILEIVGIIVNDIKNNIINKRSNQYRSIIEELEKILLEMNIT